MAGRPSDYSEAIADRIVEGLIDGLSMRQICLDPGMPSRSTVIRWLGEKEDFKTKCAHAREMQADLMDDLIMDTANGCTPETAQSDKVKISAYQWRAMKLAPKKYGELVKHEHGGPDGSPIPVSIAVSYVKPEGS